LVAVTVFRVVWMWVMLSKLPPYYRRCKGGGRDEEYRSPLRWL